MYGTPKNYQLDLLHTYTYECFRYPCLVSNLLFFFSTVYVYFQELVVGGYNRPFHGFRRHFVQ